MKTDSNENTTYASTQHTPCAVCGKDTHTPLRVDDMGGYVCLTCIDKELENRQKEIDFLTRIRREASEYTIQLQRLLESLSREDTPYPELHHYQMVANIKNEIKELKKEVERRQVVAGEILHSRNKWHMVCNYLTISPEESCAADVIDKFKLLKKKLEEIKNVTSDADVFTLQQVRNTLLELRREESMKDATANLLLDRLTAKNSSEAKLAEKFIDDIKFIDLENEAYRKAAIKDLTAMITELKKETHENIKN
jgi:hypothetical protein